MIIKNKYGIVRMSSNYALFQSRVKTDPDGYSLNPLRLDDLEAPNAKRGGAKSQETAKTISTGGGYSFFGESLYPRTFEITGI